MDTEDVITMRKPLSGFFLLDSADRNLTGASTRLSPEAQPWNNFSISKPQPLLDGFAKNLAVTEILFPWAIPNITTRNNIFYIEFANGGIKQIEIGVGFYNGTALAQEIQNQIDDLQGVEFQGNAPYVNVDYNQAGRYFSMTVNNENNFTLYSSENKQFDFLTWTQNASLLKTLGFNPAQQGQQITDAIIGSPTFIRYTNYVDIVSSRLHYDNDIKDGDSSQKTIRDILCRVYCANEVSTFSVDEVGTAPFLIHRQFMTPKYIKLNPKQFFNAIDIKVFDQYGDLVYTPPTQVEGADLPYTEVYPDFVLTMVSSEQ
jgi:hypothetical protein